MLEGLGSISGTPHGGKRNDNYDSGYTASVLL